MALAPLATAADLSARGIDVSDATRTAALLAAASAAVRDAAGSPIAPVQTSTIELYATSSPWIDLPVRPVRSVTAVSVNGAAVEQFKVVDGRLWSAWSWGSLDAVRVTVEHGLDEAPADVVDLVCSLVAAGAAAAQDGYDPKRGMAYERIDDYQYGLRQGDAEVVSPMLLPDATRAWLRARFGGGVYVTGSY